MWNIRIQIAWILCSRKFLKRLDIQCNLIQSWFTRLWLASCWSSNITLLFVLTRYSIFMNRITCIRSLIFTLGAYSFDVLNPVNNDLSIGVYKATKLDKHIFLFYLSPFFTSQTLFNFLLVVVKREINVGIYLLNCLFLSLILIYFGGVKIPQFIRRSPLLKTYGFCNKSTFFP